VSDDDNGISDDDNGDADDEGEGREDDNGGWGGHRANDWSRSAPLAGVFKKAVCRDSSR